MKVSQVIRSKDNILNVYVTAGFPHFNSMPEILVQLSEKGADMIEVGMPYSDPMADGLAIQYSSHKALKHGMNMDIMFDQLMTVKGRLNCPVILMGYVNQLFQYGVEKFLEKAQQCGVTGTIIPDLPMEEYEMNYQSLWEKYAQEICFLVTPHTSMERIIKAAALSTGFLYVVSQGGLTGNTKSFDEGQLVYFQKIMEAGLGNQSLIGFGVHEALTMRQACTYTKGAIVGSAFIRLLDINDISTAVDHILRIKER